MMISSRPPIVGQGSCSPVGPIIGPQPYARPPISSVQAGRKSRATTEDRPATTSFCRSSRSRRTGAASR